MEIAAESTDGMMKRYFMWCMACGAQGPLHIDTDEKYVGSWELWQTRGGK